MDPMTIAMILSALGGVGSLFMKDNRQEDALKHLNTGNILGDANKFYQSYLGSPAYAGMHNSILAGTQGAVNRLTSSLGQRGLSTSGIGAIAPSLAMSGGALKQSDLLGKLWMQALDSAMNLGQSRAGVGTALPSRNYGADLLGGGMDALSAFLMYSGMLNKGKGNMYPYGWHPPMAMPR